MESAPVFHFLGNKAGVGNASSISDKIQEITKGSSFYYQQEKKRKIYLQKIEKMKEEISNYKKNTNQVQKLSDFVKREEEEIKKNMQSDRVWAHFDMDMFYVACELLDKPELRLQNQLFGKIREKPVAVGGISMLSTANYVARKFGVRSAMPGYIAKKLCPQLIILPCNFEKYRTVSNIFLHILKEVDPELESMGMDEANLDITDVVSGKTSQEILQYCDNLRQKINHATQLTASCGIGPNKMIAKIASEKKKPNGIFMVNNDVQQVIDFIKDLPVRKFQVLNQIIIRIPGIGNVMEQLLHGLGIETCQQIRERAEELFIVFTKRTYEFLLHASWGDARNFHVDEEDPQSVSCQRTFPSISQIHEFEEKIEQIAENLSSDMQSQSLMGKLLTLTVKTTKFETKSKQIQLSEYIQSTKQIITYGKQILKQMLPLEPLRLIGLRLSQLIDQNDFKRQSLESFFIKKKVEDENLSISNMSIQVDQSEHNSIKLSKSDLIKNIVICPICNKEFDCLGNISRLNKHIDNCLTSNNQEVSEPAQELSLPISLMNKDSIRNQENPKQFGSKRKKEQKPDQNKTIDQMFKIKKKQ